MDKKVFTFWVTTNRKGVTHQVSVSSAWVRLFAFFGFVAGVIVITAFVDYMSLLIEAGESKRLRAENANLKAQFSIVGNKVNSLESGLEKVKQNYTRLKLITNVDDENRALNLTVGSGPQDAGPEGDRVAGWVDRKPSKEFLEKTDSDATFLARPPLDEAKNELHELRNSEFSSLSIRIDRAVKEAELQEQSVLDLYTTLSERQSLLAATPNIRPVNGWFTSRFGYRNDPFSGRPVMHAGLDIAAAPGTPVYSSANGVVSYVGYEAGYGRIVVIDHGYGVKTRYAHNSRVYVEVGQKIKRRDLISAVGSTGKSSGPHLHYEVRIHDVPVDPINYVLDEF